MSDTPCPSSPQRCTRTARLQRDQDYYRNETAKSNTIVYLTRVSFATFVVFAMYLLLMFFYFRSSEEEPRIRQRVVYVHAPDVRCVANGSMDSSAVRQRSVKSVARVARGKKISTGMISVTEPQVEDMNTLRSPLAYPDHLVFCFLNHTSYRRETSVKFDVKDIPARYCTHVVYCCAGVDNSFMVRATDPVQDVEKNGFSTFTALKEHYPVVEFLLSVGDGLEDWKRFQDIVSSDEAIKTFVGNLITWIRSRKFDGVVINWLYPRRSDKRNLNAMVKELKTVFSRKKLLVALTLPHEATVRRSAFDVPTLAYLADYLLYDMFSLHKASALRATFPITNEDIALFPKVISSETGTGALEKACFVLPLYGLSFTLKRRRHWHVGASARGLGKPGAYTKTPGVLAYNEICSSTWTVVKSELFSTFAAKGNQWVGYHDARNLRNIMRLMKRRYRSRCFGLWEVSYDDFLGRCGMRFPIVQSCYRNLRSEHEDMPEPAP